jgi:hypothetical protein
MHNDAHVVPTQMPDQGKATLLDKRLSSGSQLHVCLLCHALHRKPISPANQTILQNEMLSIN